MSTFRWTNPSAAVDAVEALVARVATEVQRDAKVNAPVDTGALRASITVGKVRADTARVTYSVGTNVFYAPFQEFGTSRGVPAKAFLGRALAKAAGRYG